MTSVGCVIAESLRVAQTRLARVAAKILPSRSARVSIVAAVSSFVSRWVVRREHPVGARDLDADGVLGDGALEQWIHDARDAYLERCAVVQRMIHESELLVRMRMSGLPRAATFGRPATVVVSAGVTEVYPTAFTMAFRVRSYGQVGDNVVNATCRVSLEDPTTGDPCELGNDVRDELIALEHSARHTN